MRDGGQGGERHMWSVWYEETGGNREGPRYFQEERAGTEIEAGTVEEAGKG